MELEPMKPAVLKSNVWKVIDIFFFTGLHHGPTGHPTEDADMCLCINEQIIQKVDAHLDELELNEEYMLDDAEIMIIAYGSVSLEQEKLSTD